MTIHIVKVIISRKRWKNETSGRNLIWVTSLERDMQYILYCSCTKFSVWFHLQINRF